MSLFLGTIPRRFGDRDPLAELLYEPSALIQASLPFPFGRSGVRLFGSGRLQLDSMMIIGRLQLGKLRGQQFDLSRQASELQPRIAAVVSDVFHGESKAPRCRWYRGARHPSPKP